MEQVKMLETDMAKYAQNDVIVAFSGGADSSLLLKLACENAERTGRKVYAVTVQTRLHTKSDLETAKKVAAETGAVHRVLEIDELKETGIEDNPKNRCYLCKRGIFLKIKGLAEELHVPRILEGTNEDDLHQYRPGIQALKELGIISPFADNGITKAQVRYMADKLGISTADRPAAPCLATRLPYGTHITYELLQRIEAGEEFLRELGYYNVRLRIHGDIARIEVDAKDLSGIIEQKEIITERLKKLDFKYITVDLEGFRSGSMDI